MATIQNGIITTDIGNNVGNGSVDTGSSIIVQVDGKILLGGTSDGRFALVRYNSNGFSMAS